MKKLLNMLFSKKVDMNSITVKKVVSYDDQLNYLQGQVWETAYRYEGGRM